MISADRAENEEARKAQVAAFLESDMTAKDWCAMSGMSLATLRYWRHKLTADGAQNDRWVDIAAIAGQGISPSIASGCTAITPLATSSATVCIGAFTIEVLRTTDAEALRKALAAAASLC
jgi:hypothetical protein